MGELRLSAEGPLRESRNWTSPSISRVVHACADYSIHARSLDPVEVGDEAGKVRHRARGGECARDEEQRHLLAKVGDADLRRRGGKASAEQPSVAMAGPGCRLGTGPAAEKQTKTKSGARTACPGPVIVVTWRAMQLLLTGLAGLSSKSGSSGAAVPTRSETIVMVAPAMFSIGAVECAGAGAGSAGCRAGPRCSWMRWPVSGEFFREPAGRPKQWATAAQAMPPLHHARL